MAHVTVKPSEPVNGNAGLRRIDIVLYRGDERLTYRIMFSTPEELAENIIGEFGVSDLIDRLLERSRR